MIIIGISGQTGAGKSTFAHLLSDMNVGENLEVDEIGHVLLDFPSTKRVLCKLFGETIIDNNKVSRSELGKIVFSEPNKLKQLNSVMHPLIYSKVCEIITDRKQKGANYLLINAALLFTIGLDKLCDHIVYLIASEQKRIKRLVNDRGYSLQKAESRINMQDEPPEDKSIIFIKNNEGIAELKKEAERLVDLIIEAGEQHEL